MYLFINVTEYRGFWYSVEVLFWCWLICLSFPLVTLFFFFSSYFPRFGVLLGWWGFWEAGSWRKRRLQHPSEHRKAQWTGSLPNWMWSSVFFSSYQIWSSVDLVRWINNYTIVIDLLIRLRLQNELSVFPNRGKGDYFRLGHGTDVHVRKPQMVEGLRGKKIVHVAVGALHCLAVTDTGQVCTDPR